MYIFGIHQTIYAALDSRTTEQISYNILKRDQKSGESELIRKNVNGGKRQY